MGGVTARVSSAAYHAIVDDKVVLPSESREALGKAVLLADAWWVVDATDEATRSIEEEGAGSDGERGLPGERTFRRPLHRD